MSAAGILRDRVLSIVSRRTRARSPIGSPREEALAITAANTEAPPAESENPPESATSRRGGRRRPPLRIAIEWVSVAAVALVLAIGVRSFAFQAFYVPSGSMIPTLQVGDRILVDKLFFNANGLHTGDIIVFRPPPKAETACSTDEAAFVKRVIGTPGDRISSRGNSVYIDGKQLSEPYLPSGQGLGMAIKPQTVPAGEYFVMGDNRVNSCDSRYWGDVPANRVIGKVVVIWWRNGRPDLHFF